jgi:Type IV secretion-system coupling protein DNA-binding domain
MSWFFWGRPRQSLSGRVDSFVKESYQKARQPKPLKLKNDDIVPLLISQDINDPNHIPWGGHYIPFSHANHHFGTFGATGTAKSVHSSLALNAILDTINAETGNRLVLLLTKDNELEILEAKKIPYTLINLNDVRAAAWDVEADCNDYWKAIELNRILFPPEGTGDPFWQDGARAIVDGVTLSFIHQEIKDWGLHDVYNGAVAPVEDLIKLLEGYPGNKMLIEKVLRTEAERTRDGIMMQLFQSLRRLQPAAAHSQHASKKFSLRKFLRSHGVLVIALDETGKELSKPSVQAMFRRLADFLIYPEAGVRGQTFISIDELRSFGKLPGLLDLVSMSRSQNVSVMLTTQGVDGIRKEYGEEETDELLGLLTFKAFFRAPGGKTAQWASAQFGSIECWSSTPNTNYSSNGASQSENKQRYKREQFLDSEFLSLAMPSMATGLQGIFLSPWTGGYKETIDGEVVESLKPERVSVPRQISKPKELQIVCPWNEKERAKFFRTKAKDVSPDGSKPTDENLPIPKWIEEIRQGVFEMVADVIEEAVRETNKET